MKLLCGLALAHSSFSLESCELEDMITVECRPNSVSLGLSNDPSVVPASCLEYMRSNYNEDHFVSFFYTLSGLHAI